MTAAMGASAKAAGTGTAARESRINYRRAAEDSTMNTTGYLSPQWFINSEAFEVSGTWPPD